MRIPEILMLLDKEIARLKLARELLAGSQLSPKIRQMNRVAATGLESAADESAAVVLEQPAAVVTVVPPATRRGRRTPVRQLVPAQGALTSSIPTGPVAVRAADLKAAPAAVVVDGRGAGARFLIDGVV